MKPAATISMLLIAFSFSFAQSGGSETDISQLVKKQIEEVKSKEQKGKETLASQEPTREVSNNVKAEQSLKENREMQFKIFLLVDACFAAALFVLWRRRKAKTAEAEKTAATPTEGSAPSVNKEVLEAEKKANEIKEQLEQVKLTGKKAEELKKIRRSLQTDPMFLNLTGDLVGKKAKQLSISKGEIYLAARIKSQQMAGECLES
jgi:hypothetical protein